MKTTAVFCFLALLGLAVARNGRGPCGCRRVFDFCANDYTTYHSICEYQCKHPSTQFQDWYILYDGPCHSDFSEPDTTTKRSYAYATTEEPKPVVEWIHSSLGEAASLSHRAVVAGDDSDGSPLWVIRVWIHGILIPGKYAVKRGEAYVLWQGYEETIKSFEVCCAPAERIRWVSFRGGALPFSAVPAGHTAAFVPLYVGRAKHKRSLTPGKVDARDKMLYISYWGSEIKYNTYEILCKI